jgi:mannose-6-phosphate isomerase-like protein (cupin superfamily)
MIIKREDMKTEVRDAMRGGPGSVKLTHLEAGENMKNCRLLSEIVLPPGSGIGEHEHINETEYYIITAGEGIVVDNGVDTPVKAGEVVATPHGNSHSITNTGSVDLTMIAVIITY